MNKELAEVIKLYSTAPHKELSSFLLDKSKNNLIGILIDLLTLYYNDKNSSTLRQFLVVSLSGYEMNNEKIGYNGYRQTSISTPKIYCEAKPKNINTSDKKIKKLDGGGNFTDYTFARLRKDLKANPMMIIGGFIDGKLVYIFEFPFKIRSFVKRLREQLKRHFPNGYEKGRFLRSASFSFKNYKDNPLLKTRVFIGEKDLNALKPFTTKIIFDILSKKLNDKKI